MFLIGADEGKQFFPPLRNTANLPGTNTTPFPHRSMPLIPSRSNSSNCLSLRKGRSSMAHKPFGSGDDFSILRPSRNAFGVERALHSTANLAIFPCQEASTAASKRRFPPSSGWSFTKRKASGGSTTLQLPTTTHPLGRPSSGQARRWTDG